MGGEPLGRSYSTGGALKAVRQEVAPQSLAPGQAMLCHLTGYVRSVTEIPLRGALPTLLGPMRSFVAVRRGGSLRHRSLPTGRNAKEALIPLR